MSAEEAEVEYRYIHPRSCERCRHEVTFQALRLGEGVTWLTGMCLRGREWGNGCAQYAERSLK